MFDRLRRLTLLGALGAAGFLWATDASAQVTTGSMRGAVNDSSGAPLASALVKATHTPSGTVYQTVSRADGRFMIPGMRVGGPYMVEVSRIGFARQSAENLVVTLGVSTDVLFRLGAVALALNAVTVTSTGGDISAARTGAATTIPQSALEQLPTISRRINDFTRLTPQASGTSYAGVDNRLNNIMVDGAYFNNSFGLAGSPGDRTGVAPISLDAIEAVQVSIAPYDVRQGNFVGAAVNTVTKSGDNEFSGSLYYLMRDNSGVGTRAGSNTFNPGTFDFSQIGMRLGGPLIKNKLFFFVSLESDGLTEPGTTFRANEGGETVTGSVTRVLRTDLEALSSFLQTNFGYETGPFQDYNHKVPSLRLTTKLDFALNDKNKFSFRYSQLDSKTDVLLSNSASLGQGLRRSSTFGLNFQNSNYQILENIKSVVGEWNAQLSDRVSNSMIIGFTSNDESRDSRGSIFPMVDILNTSTVYTTFGFEPFTPNNELRYNSTQFQDHLTIYGDKHDLTLGASIERYESENVFYSGSQSIYVYNNLADFYLDANDYLANPARVTTPLVPVGHPLGSGAVGTPMSLNRFQVRWANVPGMEKPIQPLEVWFSGLYAQDEWRATDNLTVTAGLRVEVPKFGATAVYNPEVETFNFRDENGLIKKYGTDKLPDPKLLFSPRLGFNWDVTGDGATQVRGGTGVFTGRPAYVWISNQIGDNGMLTGFENLTNVSSRPFNPDPDRYKPTTVTGAPATSYILAFTDPNFKFPQVWRTNVAVDRKLPGGMVGTVEWILANDVNGIYYIDANLTPADGAFTGADRRPRWSVDDCPTISGVQQRVTCKITSAIVLKNQNRGNSYNVAASLEKAFSNGIFAKAAWSYGESRNTVDAGSVALGSFQGNPHSGDPNQPGVGFSGTTLGHRYFLATTYTRQFLPFGPTGISIFLDSRMSGNSSYVFSSDMNGDGGVANDLLYIPRNTSEMVFEQFVASGVTFTTAMQEAAFEALIKQDEYMSSHRGQYVERGAVFLPMLTRMDLSVTQDVIRMVSGKPHRLQFRLDILNFTNMFNSDWGRSWSLFSASPLIPAGVNGTGAARYRLRNIGTKLMDRTLQRNSFSDDVYRIQLGMRYTFN